MRTVIFIVTWILICMAVLPTGYAVIRYDKYGEVIAEGYWLNLIIAVSILYALYIPLILKNKSFNAGQKTTWILIIVFLNIIGIGAYHAKYISPFRIE